MHADHLCRWPLIVLFFYATLVDFVHTIITPIPQTYWFHISCLEAGFDYNAIGESLNIATAGAVRLLNENDAYQAFIYQKLFGRLRDTRVIGGSSNSETWSVIGMCDSRYHLRCCKRY